MNLYEFSKIIELIGVVLMSINIFWFLPINIIKGRNTFKNIVLATLGASIAAICVATRMGIEVVIFTVIFCTFSIGFLFFQERIRK